MAKGLRTNRLPAWDVGELLSRVLARHLSESSKQVVIARAERAAGVDATQLCATELPTLFAAIDWEASRFMDGTKLATLQGELKFEFGMLMSRHPATSPSSDRVEVRSEWDVSVARARGRQFAALLGANSTDVVKVMTLVSELARNIVLYTKGGRIEFTARADEHCLRVRAEDDGPGIPHLEEVLAGRYRSRTGLGRGLIGIRRLSSRFEIETGATGTRIEAEVRFDPDVSR